MIYPLKVLNDALKDIEKTIEIIRTTASKEDLEKVLNTKYQLNSAISLIEFTKNNIDKNIYKTGRIKNLAIELLVKNGEGSHNISRGLSIPLDEVNKIRKLAS